MANKTLNTRIQVRNDTRANWSANSTAVLLKGEIGVEIDTLKIKIGDGITAWSALRYAQITPEEVAAIVVNESKAAQKLKTARAIKIAGDATGSATFDGSADSTITITIKNSGVAAGTYTKLTVDAKGIVTGATTLSAADIPTLTLSKLSDVGTAASKNVGTAAGQVPLLNASGKLEDSVLPALAIVDVYTVASQAEMLALNAQKGDMCFRTDKTDAFYILKQSPASVLANWQEFRVPACNVLSVNSKTGAVVLTKADIGLGSVDNVRQYSATNPPPYPVTSVAGKTGAVALAVANLTDGAKVLTTDDVVILNGGNANG